MGGGVVGKVGGIGEAVGGVDHREGLSGARVVG